MGNDQVTISSADRAKSLLNYVVKFDDGSNDGTENPSLKNPSLTLTISPQADDAAIYLGSLALAIPIGDAGRALSNDLESYDVSVTSGSGPGRGWDTPEISDNILRLQPANAKGEAFVFNAEQFEPLDGSAPAAVFQLFLENIVLNGKEGQVLLPLRELSGVSPDKLTVKTLSLVIDKFEPKPWLNRFVATTTSNTSAALPVGTEFNLQWHSGEIDRSTALLWRPDPQTDPQTNPQNVLPWPDPGKATYQYPAGNVKLITSVSDQTFSVHAEAGKQRFDAQLTVSNSSLARILNFTLEVASQGQYLLKARFNNSTKSYQLYQDTQLLLSQEGRVLSYLVTPSQSAYYTLCAYNAVNQLDDIQMRAGYPLLSQAYSFSTGLFNPTNVSFSENFLDTSILFDVKVMPNQQYAYVGGTGPYRAALTKINPISGVRLNTVESPGWPCCIALSLDNQYAYVVFSGSTNIALKLWVLSTQNETPLYVFQNIGNNGINREFSIALRADGKYAYVSLPILNQVVVITTQKDNWTIVKTLSVGNYPTEVHASLNDKIYVLNRISQSLSVIDAHAHTLEATISLGYSPITASMAKRQGMLYVAASQGTVNQLLSISLSNHQITRTFSLNDKVPRYLSVSEDESFAYLVSGSSNTNQQLLGIALYQQNLAIGLSLNLGFVPSSLTTLNKDGQSYVYLSDKDNPIVRVYRRALNASATQRFSQDSASQFEASALFTPLAKTRLTRELPLPSRLSQLQGLKASLEGLSAAFNGASPQLAPSLRVLQQRLALCEIDDDSKQQAKPATVRR